ncbi:MAG: hypothetical protein SFV15_05630 [Polyangiaceae bacterium]|nr:hypothetical protein [Polyangiaceae bacterium]
MLSTGVVSAYPKPSPRLRSLCRALLFLNLAYLSAALFTDALPGWKMFETVEHVEYVLNNSRGEPVDVHSVLPRSANLIDKAQLRRVVAFICEHQPGPFWFQEAGQRGRWLRRGSCGADVQP